MRSPVAREGLPFIAGAWLVVVALAAAGWWVALAVWLPVAAWVIAFFRDPQRPGVRGEALVIAPADGKVVSVITMDEPTFLGGQATRISIFMNVFNVHVNRYPAAGTVAYRHYHPGQFFNAASEKASLENEQSSVGLDTGRGRILVRQIAGLIARRIITDHDQGTLVAQGDRMGLIRFGSRVDVFLPPGVVPMVREGQTTAAGQTVIAQWR